jgi:hypothetical protein
MQLTKSKCVVDRLFTPQAAAPPQKKSSGAVSLPPNVVRDAKWPNMYRVRYPDGRLSDMVNLARAKDVAISIALRILNAAPEQEAT